MSIKNKIITILKIIGKFIVLVLIWSGGIAIIDYFDKPIEALKKPTSSFFFEFFPLLFISTVFRLKKYLFDGQLFLIVRGIPVLHSIGEYTSPMVFSRRL